VTPVKPIVVAALERARADLLDAITAIEADDVDTAVEKLGDLRTRIDTAVEEIR
jgi:hypothetical protein